MKVKVQEMTMTKKSIAIHKEVEPPKSQVQLHQLSKRKEIILIFMIINQFQLARKPWQLNLRPTNREVIEMMIFMMTLQKNLDRFLKVIPKLLER